MKIVFELEADLGLVNRKIFHYQITCPNIKSKILIRFQNLEFLTKRMRIESSRKVKQIGNLETISYL